MSKQATNCKLK